jgi:hypothetical protein
VRVNRDAAGIFCLPSSQQRTSDNHPIPINKIHADQSLKSAFTVFHVSSNQKGAPASYAESLLRTKHSIPIRLPCSDRLVKVTRVYVLPAMIGFSEY